MDANFSNFQMIDNIDDLNKVNSEQYKDYKSKMLNKIKQTEDPNGPLAKAMINFITAYEEVKSLLNRTGLNFIKPQKYIDEAMLGAREKASNALSSLNEAVKFQRALEALEEGESPTNANVGNVNLDLTPEEAIEKDIKEQLGKIKDSFDDYNKLEKQFLSVDEKLKETYALRNALSIAICIQNIVLCFKQMHEKLEKSPLKDGGTHNIVKKCWKFYDLVEKLADKSHTEHNAAKLSWFMKNHGKLINIAPYLFDNMGKVKEVTDVAENTLKNLEFWSEQNSPKYTTLSQNLKNLKKSSNRFTSSEEQYSFLYDNDEGYIDIYKCKILDNNTLAKIEGMIKAYDDALNVLELDIEYLQPDIANGGENPSMIPGIAEQNELIKTCNTLIAAFKASSEPNQTMIKAVEIAKNAKQQHAKVCQALIDADQAINAFPKFSKIRENLLKLARIPLLKTQEGLTKVLKDMLQNRQSSGATSMSIDSSLDAKLLNSNLETLVDILKTHNVVCNLLEQSAGQSLDELFNLPPQLQSFDFHKTLDDFENTYIQYFPGLGKSMNMFKGQKYTILHNIVEKFKRLGEEVGKAQSTEKALEDLALDTLESNNSSLGPQSNPFLRESLKKFRNVHTLANKGLVGPNANILALADEAAIDLIAHANDINVVEEIRSNVPANFSLYQYSEIAAQNLKEAQTQLIRLMNDVSDFYPKIGQYALQNIRSALSAHEFAKAQLNNVIKSYELLTENERDLRYFKEIDNYLQNAQQPYTWYTQQIFKVRDEFLQKHNEFVQRLMLSEFGLYDPEVKDSLENFRKAASEISSEKTESLFLLKDFH